MHVLTLWPLHPLGIELYEERVWGLPSVHSAKTRLPFNVH